MAILSRISRLFRADFHALLDQLEEPDVLLKQALREMEDQLALAAQEIHRHQKHETLLRQRIADREHTRDTCQTDIEMCFLAEDEKLARAAVKRKLLIDRELVYLREQLREAEENLQQLRDELQRNQQAYECVKQKAALVEMTSDKTGQSAIERVNADAGLQDELVDLAYLKEKKQFEKNHRKTSGA